ncbi:transporter, major facilitator family protein [Cardiosporidium cionae]|uniref:Transporter, major facilitator family protein n=1 Tax=Cardiosporidium cionae TaxID=476202 RepID=A0ABQ7JAS7_9APIC|nr:transporter, major facilitator family protein [Cardiosporidium cionae]|eukprot:KAF8821108.1 transporter, major facilitator family protein [Cardiosporidium cionae]
MERLSDMSQQFPSRQNSVLLGSFLATFTPQSTLHSSHTRVPLSISSTLLPHSYSRTDTASVLSPRYATFPENSADLDERAYRLPIHDLRNAEIYLSLATMLIIAALCNFDHGAIPPALGQILSEFPMGYIEQSLLGSLVYFGLILGTLLAGVTFQHISAKWILVASLCGLSLFLYLFTKTRFLGMMYVARFFSGACQALPIVYIPVWIDDFAPKESLTKWMSYSQLASIFGIVGGYLLGGLFSHWHYSPTVLAQFSTSWRTAFILQAAFVAIIVVVLAMLPKRCVNLSPTISTTDTQKWLHSSTLDNHFCWRCLASSFSRFMALLCNPLYIIITLGMSNLYFVFTGIQFWVTEYMIDVLKQPKLTVVYRSAICFLTAPTLGIWFGGYICDLCGGYRGGQQKKAVKVATVFAGLAAFFACLATQFDSLLPFTILLWFCVFFGASLAPAAVGIVLSCVPPHYRSLSSAVSQLAYNLFGWSAAPLLSGIVMEIIATKYSHFTAEFPIRIGFNFIMGMSIVGFLLFLLANFVAFPTYLESNFSSDEIPYSLL